MQHPSVHIVRWLIAFTAWLTSKLSRERTMQIGNDQCTRNQVVEISLAIGLARKVSFSPAQLELFSQRDTHT